MKAPLPLDQHTPGPWKLIHNDKRGGWLIADVNETQVVGHLTNQKTDYNAEADRLLMAAAPELLAALEAVLMVGRVNGPAISSDTNLFKVIEKTVTKAKGRS